MTGVIGSIEEAGAGCGQWSVAASDDAALLFSLTSVKWQGRGK